MNWSRNQLLEEAQLLIIENSENISRASGVVLRGRGVELNADEMEYICGQAPYIEVVVSELSKITSQSHRRKQSDLTEQLTGILSIYRAFAKTNPLAVLQRTEKLIQELDGLIWSLDRHPDQTTNPDTKMFIQTARMFTQHAFKWLDVAEKSEHPVAEQEKRIDELRDRLREIVRQFVQIINA